jgi:hypothetical protein
VREAGDKTGPDRIVAQVEHDRDGPRRLFGHTGSWGPGGDDEVDLEPHELARQSWQLISAACLAGFDREILSLDPPECPHRIDEALVEGGRALGELADPVHLAGLLRLYRERLREEAQAKGLTEGPPVHPITRPAE